MGADLTPFGFTTTESLVYRTLLHLGPATGYAVARAARLARANAYGALDGLVTRGAATKAAGPAGHHPPAPPQRPRSGAGAADRGAEAGLVARRPVAERPRRRPA